MAKYFDTTNTQLLHLQLLGGFFSSLISSLFQTCFTRLLSCAFSSFASLLAGWGLQHFSVWIGFFVGFGWCFLFLGITGIIIRLKGWYWLVPPHSHTELIKMILNILTFMCKYIDLPYNSTTSVIFLIPVTLQTKRVDFTLIIFINWMDIFLIKLPILMCI